MTTTMTRMTEEEFLRMPDDGRKYELVDGDAKEVPAGFAHEVIGAHVGSIMEPHSRGKGYLAGSQAGFRMVSGNVRSPDVSFTRKERVPGGQPIRGFFEGAPDLAIEILSPSEDFLDLPLKVNGYFASGALDVWLLEPEAQRVTVYSAPTEATAYGPDEEIEGGELLPGLRVRAADLFAVE